MKNLMKISQWLCCVLFVTSLVLSCTKENATLDGSIQGEFLKFETASEKNNKNNVLYSAWLPSQLPNSSQSSSEFFQLPLIQNKFLNLDEDLVMVYGRRNNIFTLPITMPQDAESYMVELLPGVKGTTVRLRVTSLDLGPLQDIFFRPSAKAQFRVVIVPGEKLLSFKSANSPDFEKMTYAEVAHYFNLNS
ncbi:hypothetical protein [Maribacter halichondriae]|uniref:hypothetical protein n=1 Tax=Maribacter halichondriae TaxID=2980554 RepID=UPI0023597BB8|nr:hypothetical protein [Maribacter sp. Hal144]